MQAPKAFCSSAHIDRDFSAAYSAFYATLFHPYLKYCRRLHFFSEDLSYLGEIPTAESVSREIGSKNSAYLGFVVLRPVAHAPVGSAVISSNRSIGSMLLVRSRRLELPRAFAHNDLNVARLPVPPRPHHRKRSRKRGSPRGRCAPLAKGPHPCKRIGRYRSPRCYYGPYSSGFCFPHPPAKMPALLVSLWNEVSETLLFRVNKGITTCHEHSRRHSSCRQPRATGAGGRPSSGRPGGRSGNGPRRRHDRALGDAEGRSAGLARPAARAAQPAPEPRRPDHLRVRIRPSSSASSRSRQPWPSGERRSPPG